MKYILLLVLPFLAFSAPIETEILSMKDDKAIIKVDDIQVGVSGVVVKNIDTNHSSIVANATVVKYDKETNFALLEMSKYDILTQEALPDGKYYPEVGDKVMLASSYRRALLIAENDKTYQNIVDRIPSLSWTSPDEFATFLSHKGHPTPLKSDIQEFCAESHIGLLYISLDNSLFTIDCNSFVLLQTMPMKADYSDPIMVPFFTNVPYIDSSWLQSIFNFFGGGDDIIELEEYEPYYKMLIAESNRDNMVFHKFLESQK